MAAAWLQTGPARFCRFLFLKEYIMDSIVAAVRNFADDEDGITAIEYGLIAAVMVVAVTTSFGSIKDGLETAFGNLKTKLGIT
jgi:pilus assembly protein Flp/PilA